MNHPTPTLLEIQRTLAEQDATLRAACSALAEHGGLVSVPTAIVERFAEVCQAIPVPRGAAKRAGGIRC